VSRALTLAYMIEDSISTKFCQVPLLRCKTVLVSFRRTQGRGLRRNDSAVMPIFKYGLGPSVAVGSALLYCYDRVSTKRYNRRPIDIPISSSREAYFRETR
jgi:hypothetical protein